jgi:methyl-accepting chemotaxis protein
MNWIRDLKLMPKLMLGFGVVLALLLLQSLMAWRGLDSLDEVSTELAGKTIDSAREATDIRGAMRRYHELAMLSLIKASDRVKADARAQRKTLAAEIETRIKAYRRLLVDADEKRLFETFVADWNGARKSYADFDEMMDMALEEDALDHFVSDVSGRKARAEKSLNALIQHNDKAAKASKELADSVYAASLSALSLTVLFALGGGLAIAFLFARSLSRSMGHAVKVANDVAGGQLHTAIVIDRGDEIGELLRAMQRMQHDLRERIERDQKIAAENLRIRTALDNSGTSVMIADTERTVIYANHAVSELLAQYVDDVRSQVPGLEPTELVGQPLDRFHAEFEGARLERLQGAQQSQIQLGDAHFALTVSRALDASGEPLGYVVEWRDRTPQVQVEKEVERIIRAAAEGDLSGRIEVAGKQGFYLQLAQQLNALLETNATSLEQVSRVLEALARGDLTVRMEGEYKGVFAKMRDHANDTVAQLTQIVAQIQQTTEAINTAAGEISSGNADLSQRTEQQAASLEETASSMEELTSTVRQNADNARQANQLAIGAADVAGKGGEVVGQVVTTMSAIHEASRKIVDIIGVIDGIAFQTNILALNAAVEAARAGEQGRGFAVVAAEVRSLAQRSAAAAKEIKALIGDSVHKVENGSQLVEQAGRTMSEIVTSVKRVTDIMAEITAASQEQSAGIEQVNTTITQLDEVTQQNAALVEQASAAARSLEEQAAGLAEAVRRFRLAEDAAAAVRAQRAQAAAADPVAALPARRAPARAARGSGARAVAAVTAHHVADLQHWQEF